MICLQESSALKVHRHQIGRTGPGNRLIELPAPPHARLCARGTNTGPGGTGHKICIGGTEKWSFESDGLIASSQGNFDAAEYRRQLERGMPQENCIL
jgi:hypothetical protein